MCAFYVLLEVAVDTGNNEITRTQLVFQAISCSEVHCFSSICCSSNSVYVFKQWNFDVVTSQNSWAVAFHSITTLVVYVMLVDANSALRIFSCNFDSSRFVSEFTVHFFPYSFNDFTFSNQNSLVAFWTIFINKVARIIMLT